MIPNKRYYFFIGTIAEFIKLAPVIKQIKKRMLNYKIITSGQNNIFFNEFYDYLGEVKADFILKPKKQIPSIFYFCIWIINTLFEGIRILHKEFKGLDKKNTFLIIHGDTASSFLGAIIGKIFKLRLVHVESGLRSYSFFEPFPEELLRYLNMRMADILFCPNSWALSNIKNFRVVKINTYQNTMIEIYKWAIKSRRKIRMNFSGKFYILYIRRQEHVYFRKEWVKQTILTIIRNANKNLKCVFMLNFLSERFLKDIEAEFGKLGVDNLITITRTPYDEFMKLLSRSEFIATDGCTNQEDAYYIGLPILSLRNRTERIEGLNKNVVLSHGDDDVIKDFLANYKKYRTIPANTKKIPSKIIVDYLTKTQ